MDENKLFQLKEKLKSDRELALLQRDNKKKKRKSIRNMNKKENIKKRNMSKQICETEDVNGSGGVLDTSRQELNNSDLKKFRSQVKIKLFQTNIKANKSDVKKKRTKKKNTERERESSRKRVQKFRAKMTEEQLAEKRRKDRERYKRKKEEGKVKNIALLTERQKRQQRKKWTAASAKYRRNKKVALGAEEYLKINSQPTSEDETTINHNQLLNDIPSKEKDVNVSCLSTPSSQKERGRKKVRRERANCYRKLRKAETEIQNLKKKDRLAKEKRRETKKC